MFDKEKWKNVDFYDYINKKIKEKKLDNSIISEINFDDYKYEITGDKLKGIPFAMKDNFSLRNSKTTSASKILKDFKPNYTATVYKKLIAQGAIPLFKTNLDELGMGGTGLTSNYGPVRNPFNYDYIVGGSSSGSNYLVADGTVPFALGTDTGDSVRKPASHTGVIGFKPTWGLVSRYGMYDFAPSWDTIGWFTNKVEEAALLLDVLQGVDELDNSSLKPLQSDFYKDIKLNGEKYKIAILPELEKYILNDDLKKDYLKAIDLLKNDGHKIIEFKPDFKILETIWIVYRIISSQEAFSCNSNLTGFHFGSYFKQNVGYNQGIINSRTKGFGYEVKKRFLLAIASRYEKTDYYLKAAKMRNLINKEINSVLKEVDVLLIPTANDLASKVEDMDEYKSNDILNNFLTIFNSNGSPSLSLPITRNGHLSTSINISALPFEDKKVLKLAKRLEEINEK